ncbi:hypothetical protein VAPA_2c09590 [Variovorax paradoxus B4]|uniref:Uncharacterized protein n=1 Tax=Variovorax paradoxus B4 TaxID=1246301 RepID=T1XN18_VARPD|nr:hypothetical protein VAPA_2c09590 [Variovorax paradoxus B4]
MPLTYLKFQRTARPDISPSQHLRGERARHMRAQIASFELAIHASKLRPVEWASAFQEMRGLSMADQASTRGL